MDKVLYLPVKINGENNSVFMTVNGSYLEFNIDHVNGDRIAIKVSDTDNDGTKWATANTFVCDSLIIAGERLPGGFYRLDQSVAGVIPALYLWHKVTP